MSSAEVGSKEMCLLVEFVATPYHSWLVGELALSHAVSDVCLVGPRGCGKSALVRQLATILGYRTETIQLYQVPYRTYLFSTVVIAVPLRYRTRLLKKLLRMVGTYRQLYTGTVRTFVTSR